MSFFNRMSIFGVVFSCIFLAAGPLGATEDKGQEDLNLATETKLSAENFSDLGEVIRLCESAMEKGLGEENTQFAKHLLAATLVQRARLASKVIFRNGMPDPKWNDYRRLALTDLEKAVKMVPEEPEALVLIAKLNFLPGGDQKRAAEALDQAIAIEAADKDLRASALVLRAGIRKDPKKRMADLEEALKLAPQMVQALRARGFHYAALKKSDEALKDLEEAEKIDPNHPATIEAMALLLAQVKKYDEAIAKLDKLQKLQPKLVTPLLIKAQIYSTQAKKEKALECLDKAVNLQPANLKVLLLRAALYDEMKKPKKALADIDRILEIDPKQERARRFRVILLARMGKMDEVVAELKSILEKSPDDVPVQLQLAMIHTMQNKPREAIELYSNVLAKQPNNPDAIVARASAYLTIGDHVKSIADYEKAEKLAPENSGMLNNFAWVLATSPDAKLRNGKRAVELAKKACELTEYKQAHILSTLAASYAESGDFKEAVKWSKKALELGQAEKNKEIREALEKELKSFEAGKPWREDLSKKEKKDAKPEEKPDKAAEKPKKPEAEKKPEPPKKPAPEKKPEAKKK